MKSDVPGSFYTINVSSWLFNLDLNDYPGCINGLQTSEVEKKMATLMMKVMAGTLLLTFPVVHSESEGSELAGGYIEISLLSWIQDINHNAN